MKKDNRKDNSDNPTPPTTYKDIFDESVDKLNEDHSFQATKITRSITQKNRSIFANKTLMTWSILMGINLVLFITLRWDTFSSDANIEEANQTLIKYSATNNVDSTFAKFASDISKSSDPQEFQVAYQTLLQSLNPEQVQSLKLPNSSEIILAGDSLYWNSSHK